jgi:uncharacterized protein (DUF1330 family)
MLLLATIDLSEADLVKFEAYEEFVLPLLADHGGRLHGRVRSKDQTTEYHLLYFSGQDQFSSFLNDPARVAMRDAWDDCGARSAIVELSELEEPKG